MSPFEVGEKYNDLTVLLCVCLWISGDASGHGEDTGVDVNIPEGVEGSVKVKVFTFSENVVPSEDEEG